MTLELKAGLLFHTFAAVPTVDDPVPFFGLPSIRALLTEHRLTHFNLIGRPPDGRAFAAWHNAIQRIAAEQPLGIPVTGQARSMPDRTIALTFEDGPDPRWTPAILDVLRRHGAHATFFVVGARVLEHPDLVRRIRREGHEVGVHSFTHSDLTAVPDWRRRTELALSQSALAGTGATSSLLRPPYSSTPDAVSGVDQVVYRELAEQGYLIVLSDLNSLDWTRPGVDAIVQAATPAGTGGAVVLMHDGGGDRAQTVAAVDRLLSSLDARGYHFVTVSQGLRLPADAATRPSGGVTRLRGQALLTAYTISHGITWALSVLLVPLTALTLVRTLIVVAIARRHRRNTRRQRRRLRHSGEIAPPVSVIVPAYNEAVGITDTVLSLVASDHEDLEVIVVDDGSTDGTAGIVEALDLPEVIVVRQDNQGKPAALNHGIAVASHDVLVLVDGDTVFEPDTVRKVIQPLADPAVGAVAGNTKVGNRRRLLGRWQHIEYVQGFNLDRRMFDVLECMPTVPGAIGAFHRDALESVGGVSDDTLAEDTDLTMALCRAGWRVVYAEDARAWTEAPSSLSALWRQRYRWCYGTMQAMWKHRHALVEHGAAGRFGRRGLPYLLMFQVLLPMLAPAVDLMAVYGLLFADRGLVLAFYLGFLGIQLASTAYAFRLDAEPLGPLWALPFQQIVYRQVMYLVIIQSVVSALLGSRLRWHKLARAGSAGLALDGRSTVGSAGRM
ncbi:bifunctional polysaccharide deacetylase/glycosyltransferase family 2 protein [Pseudofrankia sp. BMG5.36]|uniref:bifunctional polysaccharide deacetylase/glycosyltransferase family 2 protein n=1 Tax=Pseudofrankia sp. BMG5.36 TaxID=1834512 RepID=UPI0009F20934|nr:bifunctional polysaccharide deacetylase/glycosyltransferase family 2 protein [Pseudofrankia sp. BMG5.36]